MLPAFSPGFSRFCLLLFSSFFITVGIYAQTVKGTVIDGDKKPVAGATITVKGTTKATSSNAAGEFSINATGSDIIVVSNIGFGTLEVPVNNKSNISVSLVKSDGTELDAVVVTALGISKSSKKLGYAATTVATGELVTNRTINVMESLEGKVAGLNITPPAAGAGASNQIRLRGQVGFAGADNSPLIVINGLPWIRVPGMQKALVSRGTGEITWRTSIQMT